MHPSTTTIRVFTRHSSGCSKKEDRNWRCCNCRKSLYVYENGAVRFVSAKTRSWEQAEKLAQMERDLRDPAKRKERELDALRQKIEFEAASKKAKNITVAEATERWIASQKFTSKETETINKHAAKRIQTWASDQGIESLSDVTADMLDLWRGLWSGEAEKKYNRIGATSQSHFQGYLKRFFRYAVRIGLLTQNPAQELRSIPKNPKRTEVLTPAQYQELLDVIPRFTAAQTGMVSEFTKEFRALFLLQRWSGMRILDCLMLPRTGLIGNNVQTKTKKTGGRVDCVLPDQAVDALKSLSPDRERFLPAYFFWSRGIEWETLSTKWGDFIRDMNPLLAFTDRQGKPMKFHSHMLRDTFAVENLLAGVLLEDVSRMLTHKSIKVTEDYYGHWVPDRLAQLKQKSIDAMRRMGAKVEGK